jgi:hypothetical protein
MHLIRLMHTRAAVSAALPSKCFRRDALSGPWRPAVRRWRRERGPVLVAERVQQPSGVDADHHNEQVERQETARWFAPVTIR